MTDKHLQREALKKLRDSLSGAELAEKSGKIAGFLFGTEAFRRAKTVMTYVSFGSEPRTDAVLDMILKSGKTAAVPVCEKGFELTARAISSAADLSPGAYGIPEPSGAPIIEKNKIDLVIVPGLGFDKNGFRIGYGKGYYDRFLSDFRGISAGLCFDICLADAIARDDRDIPVKMVITESGVRFTG